MLVPYKHKPQKFYITGISETGYELIKNTANFEILCLINDPNIQTIQCIYISLCIISY